MKQTKNFNISVPELGDKPDITQVSNAIQDLEDALAGTLEIMNATIDGTVITLTSMARTTKRTQYYDGMSIKFVAPIQINPGSLTTAVVDDLDAQTLEIPYLVNAGDSVDVIYSGSKFVGTITAIQRSNAIDSASTATVATSNSVKQVNDKKAEKTIQIIAGNGIVGGGDLTANRTLSIASADEGIIVNDDSIKLNVINAVDSTNLLRPASANSVKTAYDKAMEAFNYARSLCPYRVGDILTTTLPENPAVTWIGTSWQKIEGKYLKGSKGSEASKATGGSNTKTLTVDQMPSHGHSASGSTGASGKHTHTANHGHTGTASSHTHTANHNHAASQSAHAHTQPSHDHLSSTVKHSTEATNVGWGGKWGRGSLRPYRLSIIDSKGDDAWGATSTSGGDNTGSATPAITVNTTNVTTSSATPTITINNANVTTSEITDHTHTVSVSIGATGGGKAIDIQPEYYIVHHWLRTA